MKSVTQKTCILLLLVSIFGIHCYDPTEAIPSVSINHVDMQVQIAGNYDIINGEHYEVVLDYNGSDSLETHRQIGERYAREILDVAPDYEARVSRYIRYILMLSNPFGITYRDLISAIEQYRLEFDVGHPDIAAELQGMDSVFNPYGGEKDRVWIITGLIPDNQLTLNEVYLLNMIAGIPGLAECSSLAVWGDYSATGDTIVGRNLDFFIGNQKRNRITKIHAITHFKNQGGEKFDFVSVSWLGVITVLTGYNERGLFIASHMSESSNINDSREAEILELNQRRILETTDTIDGAFDLIDNYQYKSGFATILADSLTAKIAEVDISASTHESTFFLRDSSTLLNLEADTHGSIGYWYNTFHDQDAIVTVNSFLLPEQSLNHDNKKTNFNRLLNFTDLLHGIAGSGQRVDMNEMSEIISYATDNSFDTGNIYRVGPTQSYSSITVHSVVYRPSTRSLKVHFAPYDGVIYRPDIPGYKDYTVDFD
ncbi:MAG: hypothetical protein HKP58_00395 [Desulfatitalea sp.]|nr:hypothetical protein [Desulfatitalea sp.]NNJ98849.1 hypothetical protein [Desulfatitalea sp.]